jgi:hypothetical protein
MENVLPPAGQMNIVAIFIRDYKEKLSHFNFCKKLEGKITSSVRVIFYYSVLSDKRQKGQFFSKRQPLIF